MRPRLTVCESHRKWETVLLQKKWLNRKAMRPLPACGGGGAGTGAAGETGHGAGARWPSAECSGRVEGPRRALQTAMYAVAEVESPHGVPQTHLTVAVL